VNYTHVTYCQATHTLIRAWVALRMSGGPELVTGTQLPRPERTTASIEADLLDRLAAITEGRRRGHAFLESVMFTVYHAQIDALLHQWEASRS
jgi:hypothetical protein